jgi:hypothetical protein
MNKVVHLAVWLLLSVITPLFAAESPSRIEVSYDVLKASFRGITITETYTRTQDHYHIERVSKAVGLLALIKPETIRETSEGTVTAKGLRPLTYIQNRILDTERNTRADFDWNAERITLTDHTGSRTFPLSAGTQDLLSAMYQFMFLTLKSVATLDFYMTNGRKVDIYNYRITHGQSVTVPLGTFKALYVASVPEPEVNRTEIWLAEEHANFPYKMVITDKDGGKLSQVITKFEYVP